MLSFSELRALGASHAWLFIPSTHHHPMHPCHHW